MKKWLLLLVSLFVLSPVSAVSAQEMSDLEGAALVMLNETLYDMFYLNFNPITKTYGFVATGDVSVEYTTVLDGEASDDMVEGIVALRDEFIGLQDFFTEIFGTDSGYTLQLINGKDVDQTFLEIKDGEVLVDLLADALEGTDEAAATNAVDTALANASDALNSADSFLESIQNTTSGDEALVPMNAAEAALKKAQIYVDYMDYSIDDLYDQLIFEGYTEAEVEYAIENVKVD
ncbi:Ltp family lipoprotein [Fundicoccus culcitae]|uniref:Ltp family lipoprotein n=1 Tax=Fundicoccus culcitae TaxID=2969821 RepID=A0ABY5P4F1_9LACT|nr:Ltp family lipoprotein [Fundicoccus culcitae]UUX33490.1 Ltp family lipoprotein [Fundicoccus culcitae]